MRPLDYLDAGARDHPNRPLLVTASAEWTYGQVARRSRRIASRLHRMGLQPGDHGAVLAPNDPDAFVCTLGLMRAGLVWIPINPRNTQAENARILGHLDCDVLFVHSEFADIAAELAIDSGGSPPMVVFDRDLDYWLGDATSDVDVYPDPDDVAMIAPTSGTTGKPKGVMLTVRNVVAFSEAYVELLGHDRRPVYLAAAPMTHAAGRTCFPIMAAGGTIAVIERPEPRAVLAAIERHRVTEVFLPPTAVYSLLDEPALRDADLSSLRYLMYGAAPMRTERIREALSVFGGRLLQGYGQTEAPMMLAHLRPEDHYVDGEIAPDDRLSSCGRPTPVVDVAILDAAGRPGPVNDVGEVGVRGDVVMKGYYKDPAATTDVFRNGWLHTGDVGYLDEDGYLHLVDRVKDMIVTGGFNVYSAEVEGVLAQHPSVDAVAVIGVPDERWGEAVKAIVRLHPGREADAAGLIDMCKEQLGSVKAPKSVEFWPEIPTNDLGKVLKRQIRESYWAGQERRV